VAARSPDWLRCPFLLWLVKGNLAAFRLPHFPPDCSSQSGYYHPYALCPNTPQSFPHVLQADQEVRYAPVVMFLHAQVRYRPFNLDLVPFFLLSQSNCFLIRGLIPGPHLLSCGACVTASVPYLPFPTTVLPFFPPPVPDFFTENGSPAPRASHSFFSPFFVRSVAYLPGFSISFCPSLMFFGSESFFFFFICLRAFSLSLHNSW